jgi:hypothetical protein
MFKTAPAAESAPDDVVKAPADLISLVELGLSLDKPAEGWSNFLAARGVEIVEDDLGRDAIARSDARQLFDERREAEAYAREVAARQEQRFIEFDEQRRARLWGGIPSDYLPPGVAPAAVMLQAVRDTQPKRMSPLQEALAGESLTFHSFAPTPEEAE